MSEPSKVALGWREWVALPGLNIPAIKAKLDTGAKSSALHAYETEVFFRQDIEWVRFRLHPLRSRPDISVTGEAPLLDRRVVKDSGGHKEERLVVLGSVTIGSHTVETPITLTNREDMLFRMLIGRRTLLEMSALVDVSKSYQLGRPADDALEKLYSQETP